MGNKVDSERGSPALDLDPSVSLGRSMPERAALPPRVRRTRILVGSSLVLLVFLVTLTTYFRIERELHRTLESKLVAILGANVYAAEQWLEEHGRLVRSLAENPRIAEAAISLAEAPQADRESHANDVTDELSPLYDTGLIVGHAVFDPRGMLVSARHDGLEPESEDGLGAPRELPRQLLEGLTERGSIVVVPSRSRFDPWLGRVAALSSVGGRRQPAAILALLVDPARLTSGLQVASWGRSGETFAFDGHGAFLKEPRFGSELRRRGYWPSEDPDFVPRVVTPEEGHSKVKSEGAFGPPTEERGQLTRMAQRATRGFSGVDVNGYSGYLGTPVVGAWQWLDRYGFGIATELRRDEAYESVSVLRSALAGLLLLLGLSLIGFLAVGRWTLRVREESALVTERLGRLARAIQPLSAALENDPSAVLLANGSGQIVYANEASRRVLRVQGQLIGESVDRAFDALPTELQEALDSGQDSIVAQGRDSEDETLLVSSRALTIDGRPHELYMLRPITRQVRRQEVEHWRKLIRVLSHELNNSLAPITSLVSSAKKVNELTCADERLDRIFDTIVERTNHLVTFLESYRAVARLPQPTPRLVAWPKFLRSLASQTNFRVTGDLPESPGYFDQVQLERALENVLRNAREAGSPEEEIELRVTEQPESFRIDVLDRGTGMSETVLKQAMLPFFSTKDGGTGVGLALCREVVEAHGGDLVLANREGGGLVVSCTLPKAAPPMSRRSISRIRARV